MRIQTRIRAGIRDIYDNPPVGRCGGVVVPFGRAPGTKKA